MRIGIDARFYGPLGKGLGRYTQKLIENLERVDTVNKYFVFLRAENFDEYIPKNPNFKKVEADFRWYSFEEQFKFPKLLKKFNLDLVHFAHFNVPILYNKKFVVTVHDLILLHFPTVKNSTLHPFFYRIKYLIYKLVIRSAIKRSIRIITVSKFSKGDILKNYPFVPQEKICVTNEACEDYCSISPKKEDEIIGRYGIIKPYIMYVGNAYPHKNLERLCLSFVDLKKRKDNLQLVLVGREDYFYSRLKGFVGEKKISGIIFPGHVPDHELDILFHNASVFVLPSLYEGFGLPPLEAMAKGVPVACSDHPCMKEILEDSAYFFNARETDQMTLALETVLDDEKLRQNLVIKGSAQVKKYSWQEMAENTLAIYNSIKS